MPPVPPVPEVEVPSLGASVGVSVVSGFGVLVTGAVAGDEEDVVDVGIEDEVGAIGAGVVDQVVAQVVDDQAGVVVVG